MHKRLVDEILMLEDMNSKKSIKQVADILGITEKTVRTDIKEIDTFLQIKQLGQIDVIKGNITVNATFSQVIRAIRHMSISEYYMLKSERLEAECLLLLLLSDYITLQAIGEILSVSRSTVLGDLEDLNSFLTVHQLHLIAYSGQGHRIEGYERDVRGIFVYIFEKEPLLVRMIFNRLASLDLYNHLMQKISVYRNVICWSEKSIGIYLTDYSFELLNYYIVFASIRIAQGKVLSNIAIEKKKDEFCDMFVRKLNDLEHVVWSSGEQEYIRELSTKLCCVNAKWTMNSGSLKIQLLTRRIISKVSQMLNLDLYMDYLLFESLAKHIERVLYATDWKTEKSSNVLPEVQKVVDNNFEIASCVQKALNSLDIFLPELLNENDVAYIVIYFCAAVDRCTDDNYESNVLIVCNGGIGTGQLLKAQLQSHFNINVCDVISSHAMEFQEYDSVDFVVSTSVLENCEVPYVTVSAMSTNQDFRKIKNYTKKYNHKLLLKCPEYKSKEGSYKLLDLLKPEYIQINVDADDWKMAVRISAEPLLKEGNIESEYIDDMIETIRKYGPYIVISKGFAIPHASTEHVIRTGMSFARLRQPVRFGAGELDPIDTICVLCSEDGENHLTAMFELCNRMEDKAIINMIEKCKTTSELYKVIQTW